MSCLCPQQSETAPRFAAPVHPQACLLPMGLTSENVAAAYGIPRDRQDAMAADSHLKVPIGT